MTKKTREVLLRLGGMAQRHKFILAGGTALALYLGHRVSEDLDFFTHQPFSTEDVYQEMMKLKCFPKILQEAENTLILSCQGVKFSAFKYPYPFVQSLAHWKGISLAGNLDIASMKVIAISQRGTKRDFVDLYSVMQVLPFQKVAEQMVQMFGKERINPIHIAKSMVYFSDAEGDPEPNYPRYRVIPWLKIKNFFKKNIKQIALDLNAAGILYESD